MIIPGEHRLIFYFSGEHLCTLFAGESERLVYHGKISFHSVTYGGRASFKIGRQHTRVTTSRRTDIHPYRGGHYLVKRSRFQYI